MRGLEGPDRGAIRAAVGRRVAKLCHGTAERQIREPGQREGAGSWGPWKPGSGHLDSVPRATEHRRQTYVGSDGGRCAVGKPRPCSFSGEGGWGREPSPRGGRTGGRLSRWLCGGGQRTCSRRGCGLGVPSHGRVLEGRSLEVSHSSPGQSQGQLLSASRPLGLAGRSGEAHVRCSRVCHAHTCRGGGQQGPPEEAGAGAAEKRKAGSVRCPHQGRKGA